MARMFPASPPDFHGSLGEERVFQALRSLPDDISIIHSFRWLHPGKAPQLDSNCRVISERDEDLVLVFQLPKE